MQYHAHALAASGVDVDLVGLEGTPLSRRITDDPRLTVHRIKGTRLRIRRSLYGSSYAVAGNASATVKRRSRCAVRGEVQGGAH